MLYFIRLSRRSHFASLSFHVFNFAPILAVSLKRSSGSGIERSVQNSDFSSLTTADWQAASRERSLSRLRQDRRENDRYSPYRAAALPAFPVRACRFPGSHSPNNRVSRSFLSGFWTLNHFLKELWPAVE